MMKQVAFELYARHGDNATQAWLNQAGAAMLDPHRDCFVVGCCHDECCALSDGLGLPGFSRCCCSTALKSALQDTTRNNFTDDEFMRLVHDALHHHADRVPRDYMRALSERFLRQRWPHKDETWVARRPPVAFDSMWESVYTNHAERWHLLDGFTSTTTHSRPLPKPPFIFSRDTDEVGDRWMADNAVVRAVLGDDWPHDRPTGVPELRALLMNDTDARREVEYLMMKQPVKILQNTISD